MVLFSVSSDAFVGRLRVSFSLNHDWFACQLQIAELLRKGSREGPLFQMFPLSLQYIISNQMRPRRLRAAWFSRLLRHPARRQSGCSKPRNPYGKPLPNYFGLLFQVDARFRPSRLQRLGRVRRGALSDEQLVGNGRTLRPLLPVNHDLRRPSSRAFVHDAASNVRVSNGESFWSQALLRILISQRVLRPNDAAFSRLRRRRKWKTYDVIAKLGRLRVGVRYKDGGIQQRTNKGMRYEVYARA